MTNLAAYRVIQAFDAQRPQHDATKISLADIVKPRRVNTATDVSKKLMYRDRRAHLV